MKHKSFLIPALFGFCAVVGTAWALQNVVSIKTDTQYRYIASNGIPDHTPGQFPNSHNPNSISPQDQHYKVPLHPKLAGKTTALGHYPFGVAVNGVIFDPLTAEFWNRDRSSGWNYAALTGFVDLGMDDNNAHVQPNGTYHYHGIPTGMVKGSSPARHSKLIGYAADGFPIYALYGYKKANDAATGIKELESSYRVKSGTRPSGPGGKYDGRFEQDWEYAPGHGDLDECNGRSGVTPDYPEGTYYYVLTDHYPFIPRCFKGTPDSSFFRHPGGAGGPGGPGGHHHRPPPPGGFPPPPPR